MKAYSLADKLDGHLTRRQFVGKISKVASAVVVGSSFLAAPSALGATPVVRRDIGALGASDPILLAYRRAIKAMRALPSSNPRSWAYQAAIHGTTASPALTAWNSCQHGTLFFWSWHRMYLYWFERIIRKMAAAPDWALPYWNWSSAAERQLPGPFRDPASELYTANRKAAMNGGASLLSSYVGYTSAFSFTGFAGASSSLEGTPHGAVHVGIGGWMGSVTTAGRDPIFYLHHSNIDRLWNLWLARGGGRTDPLSNSGWKNTQFTFFDENGSRVRMTGCDVLRCAAQLDYRYEGEPTQVQLSCLGSARVPAMMNQRLLRLPIPEVVLGSEPVSVPLPVGQLGERATAALRTKGQRLLLELDAEADRQPGVVWEVYLGLAAGAKADSKGPSYIGNIALFGAGIRNQAHHGFKPAHFAFPVNPALAAAINGKIAEPRLTFVPTDVSVGGRTARVRVQSQARITQVILSVEEQAR